MGAEGPGNKARATLVISGEEARAGTTRTLALPGGRTVTVSLPAGIQSGYELRVSDANGEAGREIILTIAVAPSESFGSRPYPLPDANASLETVVTPPPPPPPVYFGGAVPARPSYPGITVYPPQGPISSYAPYVQPSQYGMPGPAANPQQFAQYSMLPGQLANPQQPAWTRSVGLTILLVALALLVAGGGILTYYTSVYEPERSSAQATATVRTQVAGTADVHATGTAQVQATAQAYVNATATVLGKYQEHYRQVTSGTPKLQDALDRPSINNWVTGSGCFYRNNSYYAKETKVGYFYICIAKATNFTDFAFQVKMKIISGEGGGMVLRSNTDLTKLFRFYVGLDGTYSLYYYPDETGKTSQRVVAGISDLILTGEGQENLIAVIMRGSTFELYVNGKYLDSGSHDGIGGGGVIGLIARSSSRPTEVAYTQAQVWTL